MRWIYILAVLAIATFPAKAARTETCKAQADDKKLSGPSLKSFMNNCRREAKQLATRLLTRRVYLG